MDQPLVDREEAAAALGARAELGAELEPQVVDAFVERIERRLEERLTREAAARSSNKHERARSFVIALVSLSVGIPITAIALSNGGLVALAIVWAGIVLVNMAVARAR